MMREKEKRNDQNVLRMKVEQQFEYKLMYRFEIMLYKKQNRVKLSV